MSTPEDQLQLQQQSPLDRYMAQYGTQLQSMLAGDPYAGAAPPDGASAEAGRVSDLGPDLYQPRAPQMPTSALAATAGGGGPAPQGQPGGAPQQSALAPGAQPGTQGGDQKGYSFRDMWNEQTQATRQKYLTQLQDHLKQTNQSIDSAYKAMMDQLGGRPSTKLSRSDKGMLLMEFGLRMMEHSQGKYGQTNGLGGVVGQSGVETMQSTRGLMAQKQQQQQRYDQMQQQLTIAHGKEKAQLASRSALEEGRDIRAYGQQNSMLERVALQQEGANNRNEARIGGAKERTETTEAGKDRRARLGAGQVKRTVTGDDGSIYGVTGTGALVQLEKDGKGIKANPGGGPGGGKLTAAQANYNLYMSTYGKDQDGKPLEGEDLQAAQTEALKYAANPRTYQLSEPQMRQMAEKSADSFVRANPTSWLGMDPKEIEAKRAEYAETEFNRLKRGGPANPVAPARPRSALESTAPGGSPTRGATASALSPSAATKNSPGQTGAIPTQPQPGKPGPNARQLELLNSNPKDNARFFLQKFGYLPREYQQYAQPQSALAR
jgi:hypothetical protein